MKNIRMSFVGIILGIIVVVTLLQWGRLTAIHSLFPMGQTQKTSLSFMTSPDEAHKGEGLNVYLLENDSALSLQAMRNVEYALKYAKVPYERIERSELENLSPSPYTILVLAGEHTSSWPYETLESFVKEGGRLMVAARYGVNKQEWNDLVGIKSAPAYTDTVNGLTFDKPIFPGFEDLPSSSTTLAHNLLEAELKDEAEVYMSVQGIPAMWTYTYGEGKVGYWNSTIMTSKITRGLFLQSLSVLPPAMVMHQSGIKITYLDDFPGPIPDEEIEMLKTNVKTFYTDIWWEDIRTLSETYDLALTGVIIGTYRDDDRMNTEAIIEARRYPMVYFGRQIKEIGGEIGLHGYNHQSLVTKDEPIDPELEYIPWPGKRAMVNGLKRVSGMFDHYFPEDSLKTYVPPSNIINKTGIHALVEAVPSIHTIASLYSGDSSNGSFLQEYEYDENYRELYHFPRTISGYIKDKGERFIYTDAIANFGMFSHFIHPDDLLDDHRGHDLTWEDMKKGLYDLYGNVSELYPYLEGLTQENAREKLISYQNSTFDIVYKDNHITVKGEEILDPSVVLIRLQPGKRLETGEFSFGEVAFLQEESNFYIVTLRQPAVTLEVKEETL